jgi:hypothetical protein
MGVRFQGDASQALECRHRPPLEGQGFHLETQDQEGNKAKAPQ